MQIKRFKCCPKQEAETKCSTSKKQCHTKTRVVVSNDDQLELDPEEMAHTHADHSEDQADAYEKLKLEHKNEHPVYLNV